MGNNTSASKGSDLFGGVEEDFSLEEAPKFIRVVLREKNPIGFLTKDLGGTLPLYDIEEVSFEVKEEEIYDDEEKTFLEEKRNNYRNIFRTLQNGGNNYSKEIKEIDDKIRKIKDENKEGMDLLINLSMVLVDILEKEKEKEVKPNNSKLYKEYKETFDVFYKKYEMNKLKEEDIEAIVYSTIQYIEAIEEDEEDEEDE